MLESTFPLKSAQAESDSQKQILGSISNEVESMPPEGFAALKKPNANAVADRADTKPQQLGDLISRYGVTNSTASSANAPNSTAQPRIPPRSAASPLRPLTFQESIQVNAIRQHITDMSTKTATELVAAYGADMVTKAVLLCQERDRRSPIAKKTGWIKTYLKQVRRVDL